MTVAETCYCTPQFRQWSDGGSAAVQRFQSCQPRETIEVIHDILVASSLYQLDVCMLAGSLRAAVRDKLWQEVVGETFADSLARTLDADCTVRILLWNEPHQELVSESVTRLLQRRIEMDNCRGNLQIRLSGTREAGHNGICHFVIAHPRAPAYPATSRNESQWIARIEHPHEHRDILDPTPDESQQTPADNVLDSKLAKEIGEPLLRSFNGLFDAIGMRFAQPVLESRLSEESRYDATA